MMFASYFSKNKKGFTLAEVLLVVVILGILATVAIPGIVRMNKSLNQRKADDTARELFMQAQNSLSAEKASGRLLGTGERWVYSWDSGSADERSRLFPAGAVNIEGGYYAVRYNADSAIVLETYYSLTELPDELTPFATDAEARVAAKIGFHSGEGSSAQVQHLTAPTVIFENGLELKARITVPAEYVSKNGTLTISVSGKRADGTDGDYVLRTITLPNDLNNEFVITLDSLTEGQFKDLNTGIVPGSDITVSANVYRQPENGVTYISATGSATANSLFASVKSDGEALIANERHLQNLNTEGSGVGERVIKAKQIAPITLDGSFTPIANENLTEYNGQDNEIVNLLVNTDGPAGLFAFFGEGTIKDVKLINPHVIGIGSAGALVGDCIGTAVSGCQAYCDDTSHLSNFTVVCPGGNVGGLIGRLRGGEVTESAASLYSVSGSAVGGLTGAAENGAKISVCYADTGVQINADLAWGGGLSGANVGGLVGTLSGGEISDCYACGSVNTASSSCGGILGSGSGSSSISNCYSVVTLPSDKSNGIAGGTVIASPLASYYWNGSNAMNPGYGTAKSLDEIKGLSLGTDWVKEKRTNSYSGYSKNAYPYPMLSGLAHYGDWPVEGITDINVYNTGAGNVLEETPYFLIPKGTVFDFYAASMNGSKLAKKYVGIGADDAEAGKANAVLPLVNEYTHIYYYDTATAGVKTLTLECGGCSVRAVFIVYDATVTLTATPESGSPLTNSCSLSGESARQVLSLSSTDTSKDYASFSAALNVSPTKAELVSALNGLHVADTSLGPDVSAREETLLANWAVLVGPTVNNTELSGVAVLKNITTTPKVSVTAGSAGTASVTAQWQGDPRVVAVCPIEVSGVRAFIKNASATGDSTKISFSASGDYPYKLFATPLAKETITLSLTGERFGSIPSGKTEQYTWIVTCGGKTWTATSTSPSATIKIDKESPLPISALYRVEMKYEYGTKPRFGSFKSEYATADYCYVQVDRKAGDPKSTGLQSIVPNKDQLSLEQISGNNVKANWNLNRGSVFGAVEGADDTQLLWYYDANLNNVFDGEDILLSGMEGSLPVSLQVNSRVRVVADIFWSPVEGTVNGIQSLGGTVTVEAHDVSYFGDTPLSFKLFARARNNGSDDYAVRNVTVNIMPQLQIINSTRTKFGFFGHLTETFTANRADTALGTWNWTYDCDGNPKGDGIGRVLDNRGSIKPNQLNSNYITIDTGYDDGWESRQYTFTCSYGPYSVNAFLTAKRQLDSGLSACINGEIPNPDSFENNYFLLEKNEERNLTFSWGTKDSNNKVTKEPTRDADSSLTRISGSTTPETEGGSWLSILDYITKSYSGTLTYTVNGDAFKTEMMGWSINSSNYSCPLYIVGTEFDGSAVTNAAFTAATDTLKITGRGINSTVRLQDFFPSKIGTITDFTVVSSNPDVISITDYSVVSTENEIETRNVALTSQKYGTATLTASFTVDTREYIDTLTVQVVPEKPFEAKLVPCSGSDIDTAKALFDNEASTPVFDGNGDPIMFSEFGTENGYDVLYMKAWLEDEEGNPCSAAGLVAGADLRFTSSNAYAVRCELPAEPVDNVYYLKLSAASGSLLGESVEISADFGTVEPVKYSMNVYSHPQISMFLNDGTTNVADKHTVCEDKDVLPGSTKYTFSAALSPTVQKMSGGVLQPVDVTFYWTLEFVAPAFENGYIALSQDYGASVDVSVLVNPLSKVAAKVSYEILGVNPDAYNVAHALVFLPKKTT